MDMLLVTLGYFKGRGCVIKDHDREERDIEISIPTSNTIFGRIRAIGAEPCGRRPSETSWTYSAMLKTGHVERRRTVNRERLVSRLEEQSRELCSNHDFRSSNSPLPHYILLRYLGNVIRFIAYRIDLLSV